MLFLAAIDSAGAGATDKFVPVGAASDIAGLSAPYFSASVPDGSSWLTNDRLKEARDVILEHKENRSLGPDGREVPFLPSFWDMYLLSAADEAERIELFLRSPYQPAGRVEQGIRLSSQEDGRVLVNAVGFEVAEDFALALHGMAKFLCAPEAENVSEDAGIISYLMTKTVFFSDMMRSAADPPAIYRVEGTPFVVYVDRIWLGLWRMDPGGMQPSGFWMDCPCIPSSDAAARKALLREMKQAAEGTRLPALGVADGWSFISKDGAWCSPDGMKEVKARILAHGSRKFLKPFSKEFPYLPGYREVYLLSDPDEAGVVVLYLKCPAEGGGIKGIRLSLFEDRIMYAEAVGFGESRGMADHWAEVVFPLERNPKTGAFRLLLEQGENAWVNKRNLDRIFAYYSSMRPPFGEFVCRPEGTSCEVSFGWSGEFPSSMAIRRVGADGKAGDSVTVAWWGVRSSRGCDPALSRYLMLEAEGNHEGGAADMRFMAEAVFRALLDEMNAADMKTAVPAEVMKPEMLAALRDSLVQGQQVQHLPAVDRVLPYRSLGGWEAFLLSDPADRGHVSVYLKCSYQDAASPKDRALRLSLAAGGKVVRVEALGLAVAGLSPDGLAQFSAEVLEELAEGGSAIDAAKGVKLRNEMLRFVLARKPAVRDGRMRYHVGGSAYDVELVPYRSLGALPFAEYVKDIRFVRGEEASADIDRAGWAEMIREMGVSARCGPQPSPDMMVDVPVLPSSPQAKLSAEGLNAVRTAILEGSLPSDRAVSLLSADDDALGVDLYLPVVSAIGSKGIRVTLHEDGGIHVESHGLGGELFRPGDLVTLADMLLPECRKDAPGRNSVVLEDGKDALVNRTNREKIAKFVWLRILVEEALASRSSRLQVDPCYRPKGSPYEFRLLKTGKGEIDGLLIYCRGERGEDVVLVKWYPQADPMIAKWNEEDACPAVARYFVISGMAGRERNLKLVQDAFDAILRDMHEAEGKPWPLRRPDAGGMVIGGQLSAVREWILAGKEKKWSHLAQEERPYRPGRWDMWLLSDPEEKDYIVVYMKCPYQAEGAPEKGLRLSWLGPNRIGVESFDIPRKGLSARNLRALAAEALREFDWQVPSVYREFGKETASRMLEYVLAMRSLRKDRASKSFSWYYEMPDAAFSAWLRPYRGQWVDVPTDADGRSSPMTSQGIPAPEYISALEFVDTSDQVRMEDRQPGEALLKEMARSVFKVSQEDGRDDVVTSANRDRVLAYLSGKMEAMRMYGAVYGLPPVYRVEGTPFHVMPLFASESGSDKICSGLLICPVSGADGFSVEMKWRSVPERGNGEVFDFSMRSYRGFQDDGLLNAEGRSDAVDAVREVFSVLLQEMNATKP